MPRLPYKTDEEAGPADLVAAIRQRRGGRLANLDRVLLHSPAFARGWGLRIDLLLVSDALRANCSAGGIDLEPRRWERPSDHAPVWATLE